MPKDQIYISEVREVKRGVNKNGAWVLWNVIDQRDGKETRYSTFEDKYLAMKGQEVEIEYEEKPSKMLNPKTGKPYVNKSIIESRVKKETPAYSQLTELMGRVGDLEERVQKLELGDLKDIP